jgi:hypothetical protein
MNLHDLLIVFRNAALASAAMLASQRRADHARNTEMRLVILPLADQLIDDGLLLGNAVEFRYKARVIDHGPDVEESCKAEENGEEKIE